jgi:hypothetical protein
MQVPLFVSIGKVPVLIRRKQNGQNIKGRWVSSNDYEEVPIEAHIQPAKYNDLLMLPEAERTVKALRLYSQDEIRILREGSDGWPADEFDYSGDTYRVVKVLSYHMGILDHYKAIAVRVSLTP